MRSEIVEQYEGGHAGRSTEIDQGSQREATEIIDDALEWAATLNDLFEAISDDVWARPVRTVAGNEHPVALLRFRRWREVEVHLVDLDLGVTPVNWSDGLVERALPRLVAGLAERCDERQLMASHAATRYERCGKRPPTAQIDVDGGIGADNLGQASLGDIDRHLRNASHPDISAAAWDGRRRVPVVAATWPDLAWRLQDSPTPCS